MAAISYLKRKSQNLSTAIELIYGLKLSGDADKALKMASETFTEILNFDLDDLLKMGNEAFLEKFCTQSFSLSYLELIAKFILNTSEILETLNRTKDAQNLSTKGLLLLKYIEQNDKTFSIERDELIKAWEENKN
jgi:hypothetical protein